MQSPQLLPSPTAQQDHKERNFCFAYRGEPLQSSLFECLHFQSAKGTYCMDDGLWYVSVTLDRSHGRRASSIPKVLEEYNRHMGTAAENRKVHPVCLPHMPSSVVCFKCTGPNANNAILSRISADRHTNPTYWSWDKKSGQSSSSSASSAASSSTTSGSGKDQRIKAKKPAKTTAAAATGGPSDGDAPQQPCAQIIAAPTTAQPRSTKERRRRAGGGASGLEGLAQIGLEGLARELNLNPTELDMKGAYITISRSYFTAHNKPLASSGKFDAADRGFLMDELARFFSDKLQYVSRPFRAATAGADSNGGGGGGMPSAARKLLRAGGGTGAACSDSDSILAALVATNGGSVEDFGFLKNDPPPPPLPAATEAAGGEKETDAPGTKRKQPPQEEPNPFVPETPNETIRAYFAGILPRWLQHEGGAQEGTVETLEIAARDIVAALNGGKDGGAYRTTCVAGFLRPFVSEGLIRPLDEQTAARPSRYRVNIRGVAAKLGIRASSSPAHTRPI